MCIHRASLVPQTVKNPPAMQETWVRSLGQEDPLEKEMETHSSIHAWKIPWTQDPTVHGVAKSQTRLSDFSSSSSRNIHPWKQVLNYFSPHKPFLLLYFSSVSHVRLFATLWTVACQAPLSMEFSRQEYYIG